MPTENPGGGFVDKFVAQLGYVVNTDGLKKFKAGMKSAMATTRKLATESRKTARQVDRETGRGYKQAVRKIRVQLKLAIRAVKRWRRENEKQIKRVEESWDRMSKRGGKLLSFTKKLTLSVGALTTGFAAWLGISNQATTRIEQMGKSVKVSSDFLSAMGSIVGELGFDYEHVVDMAEELNNKMGESRGLPEQMIAVKESLQILGLEFDTLEKMKPEEQFTRILKQAQKLEDHQKAVSAVDMLMGGESNKILGLLRSQNTEFDKLLFRRMQLNMLDQRGKNGAVAFTKSLAEAGIVAKSIKDQFFGLVGEGLTPMLNGFADWAAQNKELIKTKIAEYAERTVEAIKEFVVWMRETVPKVESLVNSMGGLAGVANKVKIVLSSVIFFKFLGFLVSAVQTILAVKGALVTVIPVMKAVGLAAMTSFGPFLKVLGGIVLPLAAIVLTLQDLYTWMNGGESVFKDWSDDLADAMWYIHENGEEVANALLEIFGTNTTKIKAFFVDGFAGIAQWFDDQIQLWIDTINRFVDEAVGALKSIPGFEMIVGEENAVSGSSTAYMESVLAKANQSTTNNQRINQTNTIQVVAPEGSSPQAVANEVGSAIRQMFAGAASSEGVTDGS